MEEEEEEEEEYVDTLVPATLPRNLAEEEQYKEEEPSPATRAAIAEYEASLENDACPECGGIGGCQPIEEEEQEGTYEPNLLPEDPPKKKTYSVVTWADIASLCFSFCSYKR